MPARIIAYGVGLFALLRELQYTLSQIIHEPLAAAHVLTFQALREEWQGVMLEEIAILGELSESQAAVSKADRGIDVFAGRVSRAVDEHTSDATRKQIRTALFKNRALNKFRRPVLGGQLSAMLDWSDTLARCGVPELVALAPEVAPLVEAGRSADQQRARAQQRNRDFRDVGTRKQFIDKVNAARREAYGALGKLPFQQPALPRDFADAFFYVQPPRNEEETIDQVKAAIEELETDIARRRAQLEKLEAEAAVAAQVEEERLEQEQVAEDLEAQAQALIEKAASLRAQRKKR
jgi:hypothetical protein